MTHHIVNLYYEPTEQAKKLYDGLKDALFLNAGSLETSQDEWVKKNVTFEKQFPDNIADKNKNICECTALYAVWKNLCPKWDDNDWIQLSHYRKFLDIKETNEECVYSSKPYPLIFKSPSGNVFNGSVESGTRYCHPKELWDIMEHAVILSSTFREGEMWNAWKRLSVMPAPMNMFKMKVGTFKRYCEWLFPILFEINSKIPYDKPEFKTAYQQRAGAFVSERLFSFWCYLNVARNRIKLEECETKLFEGLKAITDEEERRKQI